MTEQIKPALSAEEWKEKFLTVQARRYGEEGSPSEHRGAAEIHAGPGYLHITEHELDHWAVIDTPEQRHALAALALYNQPFGFTREDVKWVRERCDDYDWIAGESLADRLEALLPPSGGEVKP